MSENLNQTTKDGFGVRKTSHNPIISTKKVIPAEYSNYTTIAPGPYFGSSR